MIHLNHGDVPERNIVPTLFLKSSMKTNYSAGTTRES